jgi:CBS domain-containing protein
MDHDGPTDDRILSEDVDTGVIIGIIEFFLGIGLEIINEIAGVPVLGHLVAVVFVMGVPVTAEGHASVAEVSVFMDVNRMKAVGFLEAFQTKGDFDGGARLELFKEDVAVDTGPGKGRDRGIRRFFDNYFYHFY